jgi:hypothetical protein
MAIPAAQFKPVGVALALSAPGFLAIVPAISTADATPNHKKRRNAA